MPCLCVCVCVACVCALLLNREETVKLPLPSFSYGPFWVATTLIFVTAASGNLSRCGLGVG